MKILIFHRVPFEKVSYPEFLDHSVHQITYIGTAATLTGVPEVLNARKILRTGTENKDALLSLLNHETFDAVVALSEYELMLAAELRLLWRAIGPKPSDVLKVRDKVVMKAHAAAAQLKVPNHLRLDQIKANELKLFDIFKKRVVLKPVAGASSENVQIFENIETLIDSLEKKTTGNLDLDSTFQSREVTREYEVEEFIDGRILHLDGWACEGELHDLVVSEYLGNCLDYAKGAPLGSVQLDEQSDEIKTFTSRCLSALGVRDGAFHLEAIAPTSNRGQPLYFLELGHRVGGAGVGPTYQMKTGINLYEKSVRAQVGMLSAAQPRSQKKRSEVYGWFVFPGHHLRSSRFKILGQELVTRSPEILEWKQASDEKPLPKFPQITYQPFEVPIAGLMRAATTEQIKASMLHIFDQIEIVAHGL